MKYSYASSALCLLAVLICNPLQAVQNNPGERPEAHPPKYVFLFIGDGMAGAQIHAAEAYLGSIAGSEGTEDDIKVEQLTMSRFPVSGMQMSYAKNRFITGSAAAATALACGIKTDINIIAMHPDAVTPCRTVAEMAKSKGMKVGIVSSVSIDHATPAAFYAHVPNRMQYREIGQRLIGSGFDYFAGGGFLGMPDLEEAVIESGYVYVDTREGFDSLKSGERKIIAVNPWLDRNSAIPYALNRMAKGGTGEEYEGSIPLAEFTAKGIQVLENENGFFMMVEGGKIDWACHSNDARTAIEDVIAFDKAVRVAKLFAEKHPMETLVVVTGDHETGGMTLGSSEAAYDSHYEKLKGQVLAFDDFDQDILAGYLSTHNPAPSDIDSDMWAIILEYFGLDGAGLTPNKEDDLSNYDMEMLENAFDKAANGISASTAKEDRLLYGTYNPLSVTLTHILDSKAGIGWTSFSHTAVPVPVFALGIGADSFSGYYENTEVARKLANIMGAETDF